MAIMDGQAMHDESFRQEQVNRIRQKEEELKNRRAQNQALLAHAHDALGMIGACVHAVNDLPHSSQFVKENEEIYKTLRQSIEFIRDTAAEGHVVSKAYATQAYETAKEFEAAAIEYEKRWENAYAQWHCVWQQTHDLIKEGRVFTLRMNTSAGEESTEIDSDFWTHGAFDAAAAELAEQERSDETTIREFSELCERTRALYTRIEDIIEQAEQEFVRSLVRGQMGEAVCAELYARGWFCPDESCFAYKGDDRRESVILRIQNPAHDELELTFTTDNQLFLQYHFAGVHNRDVVHRLIESITQALGKIGVSAEQISQKA